MASAGFVHRVSRALDPHLHSHVVMANLGRGPEGTFTALDGRGSTRTRRRRRALPRPAPSRAHGAPRRGLGAAAPWPRRRGRHRPRRPPRLLPTRRRHRRAPVGTRPRGPPGPHHRSATPPAPSATRISRVDDLRAGVGGAGRGRWASGPMTSVPCSTGCRAAAGAGARPGPRRGRRRRPGPPGRDRHPTRRGPGVVRLARPGGARPSGRGGGGPAARVDATRPRRMPAVPNAAAWGSGVTSCGGAGRRPPAGRARAVAGGRGAW